MAEIKLFRNALPNQYGAEIKIQVQDLSKVNSQHWQKMVDAMRHAEEAFRVEAKRRKAIKEDNKKRKKDKLEK